MNEDVIYESDMIKIINKKNILYIESFKMGMTMEEFNNILKLHPEIKINNFLAVKNAILSAPKMYQKFGELRERITVDVSKDGIKAFIQISVGEQEFRNENIKELYGEILNKLKSKAIVYGLKQANILTNLRNGVQILAAEGINPVPGKDSVVNLYKIKEPKPTINQDDTADFYEMSLINKVERGDWLGERIEPTEGRPGMSVFGNVITAPKGKLIPLLYDKNTVDVVMEKNKTVLYAKQTGAVHFDGGRIGVSNHLEILENVDFKVGNINFDGYITVKGSVEDSFSVVASEDIEILGEYGIGSVKEIISSNGSIYIKGGVAGKQKALIKSEKDIYTKFISDATIISKGCLSIGSYCINSKIEAREVIVESMKGQIIGGNIEAEIKIVSPVVGSSGEIRTVLTVSGFERTSLKQDLEEVMHKIEELKNDIARQKMEIATYINLKEVETTDKLKEINKRYFTSCENLKSLTERRNIIINCLRTLGEGEIRILKKVYPSVELSIRNMTKIIKEANLATTYYVIDGEWKEK